MHLSFLAGATIAVVPSRWVLTWRTSWRSSTVGCKPLPSYGLLLYELRERQKWSLWLDSKTEWCFTPLERREITAWPQLQMSYVCWSWTTGERKATRFGLSIFMTNFNMLSVNQIKQISYIGFHAVFWRNSIYQVNKQDTECSYHSRESSA